MNESSSLAIGDFLDYARSRGAKKSSKDKRIFIYNMMNTLTNANLSTLKTVEDSIEKRN